MKALKSQADFVEALYVNFVLSLKEFIERESKKKEGAYWRMTYGDKNCGKTALLRKIVLIRQELLNLEKMIEKI